jgi:catechol 2,3-dioxygenase
MNDDSGVSSPLHRLSDVEVGPVRLQVADLSRSVEFYEGILGLELLDRSGSRASLGAADGRPLVELRERPGARPVPRPGRNGLYHFAILLPDRADLGRFLGHLGALDVPVGLADHLVSEASYLRDPDGLGIEVYADRPRDAWRHRDGEVLLTTDPLDVDDLVRAGGAGTWNGIPAGSVMGHLHLQVGSLQVASRFYHEALGLDRTMWSYPGALFLGADGYHHHLGLNTWGDPIDPLPEDARLLEWSLSVGPDTPLEAILDALGDAGGTVASDENGWVVVDPWGTALRLGARA